MRPHCRESYAEDCHISGTTLGQYQDFREHIQGRIQETLSDTSNHKQYATVTASGLYILSYWANFEESGYNADPRTVEFSTRLYSPIGNGKSIDISWYYHFRARGSIANEKYSTMYANERSLSEAEPFRPTDSFKWRDMGKKSALAILDGDSNEEEVYKTFASQSTLKEYRFVLFGEAGETLSTRKVFGLLARAAGSRCIAKENGWAYAGMRERYELYPGETSDGEEDGDEDGPSGCVIS
jgi:hypothetical protein